LVLITITPFDALVRIKAAALGPLKQIRIQYHLDLLPWLVTVINFLEAAAICKIEYSFVVDWVTSVQLQKRIIVRKDDSPLIVIF
jgi:hypothetical protein